MLGDRTSSLFIVALCLAAAPARAQTPPVLTIDGYRSIAEVAAGVSIQGPADVNQPPACQGLALPCASGRTIPDGGLALSAVVYPGEMVGVVGELSVYANQWVTYGTNCFFVGGRVPQTCPVTATNRVRAALGGIKLRSRLIRIGSLNGTSHARLFAQALAGSQWTDIGPRQRVLQPGVGLDHYLRNGVTVHVEYDYRFAPDGGRDLSTSRGLLGIALPIGSR